MKSRILGLLAMAILASPEVANANLITNGGFETGTLAGWTCSGADSCIADSGNGGPHSGTFAAVGFDNAGFATLSQTIATIAGETYDFEFWSATNNPNAAGNILRYQIGGGAIINVPRTLAWLLTTDTFVAAGGTTAINFFFETDPGTGTWRIDDVSVLAAAPEPTSLALLGLGIAGAVARRARRRAA